MGSSIEGSFSREVNEFVSDTFDEEKLNNESLFEFIQQPSVAVNCADV
jgi:hypothetical protein